MGRQARDARRNGVTVRLTPRDEDLLRALARLGLCRSRDLVALSFPGIRRDTAARRLRSLYDAGFVDVHSPGADRENLYRLAPRGRDWIEAGGESAVRVPRAGLEHHLAVVSAWVTVATHGIPCVELLRTLPDWELRTRFGGAAPVIPDLFVVLRASGREIALATEVDLGTESRRILREKFRRYELLRSAPEGLFGWRDFVLAVTPADPRAAGVIRSILNDVWTGPSLLWSGRHGFASSLQAALALMDPPIAAPPCRKGGAFAANPCGDDSSRSEDGGYSR